MLCQIAYYRVDLYPHTNKTFGVVKMVLPNIIELKDVETTKTHLLWTHVYNTSFRASIILVGEDRDFDRQFHWGKADDRNCKLRSFQDGGHEIR